MNVPWFKHHNDIDCIEFGLMSLTSQSFASDFSPEMALHSPKLKNFRITDIISTSFQDASFLVDDSSHTLVDAKQIGKWSRVCAYLHIVPP